MAAENQFADARETGSLFNNASPFRIVVDDARGLRLATGVHARLFVERGIARTTLLAAGPTNLVGRGRIVRVHRLRATG